MPRNWGNPEWLPVSCSFRTAQLWRDVNRVTVEHIQKPENMKRIADYVLGSSPAQRRILGHG